MWYRWNSLPSSAPTKVKHIANFYEFRDVHPRSKLQFEWKRTRTGWETFDLQTPSRAVWEQNKMYTIHFLWIPGCSSSNPRSCLEFEMKHRRGWRSDIPNSDLSQSLLNRSRRLGYRFGWSFEFNPRATQYEICLSTAKFKICCLVNTTYSTSIPVFELIV